MSTVVITGASRGIGAATAHALAAHHDLVLVGRNAAALRDVATGCESARAGQAPSPRADEGPAAPATGSRSVRVVEADLTTADGVAEVARVVGAGDTNGTGMLAGLVHCAGVAELGRIEDTDAGQWRRAFEVNVLAVVELTRALLPALRAARGHVVVVNSGAGTTAKPGWGSYSASKFALRAVTDTLRGEEPDLRVTSIHPGRVDTDMQRAIVAHEGRDYDPDAYLDPRSVATAVRHALESTPDSHPTEVVLRPRPR